MDEFGTMMKKLIITNKVLFSIFLTILILVAAIFSGFLWTNSSKASELKTQNANLQNQNTNLTSQRSALQNAISQLQNQLDNTPLNISQLMNQINALESQNSILENQTRDLQNIVSSLQSKATNLTTANLVTALGIVEVPKDSPHNFPNPLLYNHLYVEGSVTNSGSGIAYRAGLHVIAYAADGTEEINLTVPLVSLLNATGNEVTMFGPVFGTNAKTQIYGNDSLELGSLSAGQTVQISLTVFHESTVSTWTVTPVWKNFP
jgi:hypothetical protein